MSGGGWEGVSDGGQLAAEVNRADAATALMVAVNRSVRSGRLSGGIPVAAAIGGTPTVTWTSLLARPVGAVVPQSGVSQWV
jgi:hypothetical protein